MLRRAHRKTRTGCERCKSRRVKCDERKPCSNCRRRNEACNYSAEWSPSRSAEDGLAQSQSTDWCRDLFLMHHYQKHTVLSLTGKADLLEVLGSVIVQQAGGLEGCNPYLMHGLLSVSALHFLHLHPETCTTWSSIMLRHHTHAIEGLHSSLGSLTKENCHGLFALSIILFISSVSSQSKAPRTGINEKQSIADIIQPLLMVRGSGKIREVATPWLEEGFMQPFSSQGNYSYPTIGPLPHPLAGQLALIKSDIVARCDPGASQAVLLEALDGLSGVYRAFVAAKSTQDPAIAWGWIGRMSEDFVDLLKKLHPAALVIYAHFVILSRFFEGIWYFKGWPERAVAIISETLDDVWRGFMAWPFAQLAENLQSFHSPT